MLDLIVSVPDHCLSFYFASLPLALFELMRQRHVLVVSSTILPILSYPDALPLPILYLGHIVEINATDKLDILILLPLTVLKLPFAWRAVPM